jgi:H+/Cl- antiporter ClcA
MTNYDKGYRCAAAVFGLLLIGIPAAIAGLTGCPSGRWWMVLVSQLCGFVLGWVCRGLAHDATQAANDQAQAPQGAAQNNSEGNDS